MLSKFQDTFDLVVLGLQLAGNYAPSDLVMSVLEHTAGQPGENAAKRILTNQGALPDDVDELFKLYKKENSHV